MRGRARIIVDEWGPYDWKSPKLWPAGRSDENPLTLRVLGPQGEWSWSRRAGASQSRQSRARTPRVRRYAHHDVCRSISLLRSNTRGGEVSRHEARGRRRGSPTRSATPVSSRQSTGLSGSSSTATTRTPSSNPPDSRSSFRARRSRRSRQPARLHLRPRNRRRRPARSLRARRRRNDHAPSR